MHDKRQYRWIKIDQCQKLIKHWSFWFLKLTIWWVV